MIVLCDTREPWPHPWSAMLPAGWALERASLETGDFCLASHPHGIVIERKTSSDLAPASVPTAKGSSGSCAEAGTLAVCVVVEGSLSDVAVAARGIHHNAVLGTLASWTLRSARFSLPEAGGWLRILPGGFWPPSFLRASAELRRARLKKPGERSRKRRKAQKMNHRLNFRYSVMPSFLCSFICSLTFAYVHLRIS